MNGGSDPLLYIRQPVLGVLVFDRRYTRRWLSRQGKEGRSGECFGARGPAARFVSLRFVSLCGSGKYEDEGRLSGNLIWLEGLVSWCQGGLVPETAKVDL